MAINLKDFQKALAQYKVYNAWQYVESLNEMLTYMKASFALLDKVHEHRVVNLKSQEQTILEKAVTTGRASVGSENLRCTNLNIAGLEIDDTLYLKKTTIEFFHYARISIDILFQIINAALLGDQGLDDMNRDLIFNTNRELRNNPVFADLKKKLDANKNNDTYKYLQAFDNYNKNIKTILISINNSFLLGEENEFIIKEFTYSEWNVIYHYPNVDALLKAKEVYEYVMITTEDILAEIKNQLHNCLDNNSRIQNIKYKAQMKQTEKGYITDYLIFFIEVENSLNELPSEIKVLPLIVKPNDEIYSFDFQFDTIFIKLKSGDESSIIGYAKRKNNVNTNEFYKTFVVSPCGQKEYIEYLALFKDNYKERITINPYAMEGTMIFYKD